MDNPQRISGDRSNAHDHVSAHKLSNSYDMTTESPTSRQRRENGVHDKVAAFNNLSLQTRTGERKTSEAALKRAVLGREQAESEVRRYREETRNLRKAVDDGQRRERIVGERLEALMESIGRSKENFEHSKLSWEKEIRRLRKESFKLQSVLVKTQDELKSARFSLKAAQSDLDHEKSRSSAREQKALISLHQSAKFEHEISQIREQLMLVEKERDALREIAKNDEIARIAAEGKIPLPISPPDDEFASPRKSRQIPEQLIITYNSVSDHELEELRMQLAWEQQRSLRAYDRIELLEIECRLNCCASRGGSRQIKPNSVRLDTPLSVKPKNSSVMSQLYPSTSLDKENISPRQELGHSSFTRSHTRTPSCDPPAPAFDIHKRTSLLSLLGTPEPRSLKSSPICLQAPVDAKNISKRKLIASTEANSPVATLIPISQKVDHYKPELVNFFSEDRTSLIVSSSISREEALAQIRDRRGRARSLAQSTMTPRRVASETVKNRRDISAPAIRSGSAMGRRAIRA